MDIRLEGDAGKALTPNPIKVYRGVRKLFPIDISALPVGRHKIAIRCAGMEQYEFLEKAAPPPAGQVEIKVDRLRHIFLRNGKPLILWAACGYAEPQRFNTMMSGSGAAAKAAGMMWIPWGASWGNDLDAKKFVEGSLATGAEVAAYMFHDEPGLDSASKIQKQYREVRTLDPYRPAFFLKGGCTAKEAPGATDVVAGSYYAWGCANCAFYTLGQRDFYGIRQETDSRLREDGVLLRKLGITGWVNLTAYSGGENAVIGTPAQHRALIYLGLVHGFRNFSEWGERPASEEIWDFFVTIKRQLEMLGDILGNDQAFEEAAGALGDARYTLWSSRGKFCFVVVNTSESPIKIEYRFPAIRAKTPEAVKPIFAGDPPAKLQHGVLTLELPGSGAGAYEISG